MENAIRRPDQPEHFMVLRPVNRRVVVRLPSGLTLAESTRAMRVMEAAGTLYDPVVYIPPEDVSVPMQREERTTRCPLKGQASYFSLMDGDKREENIAWSYEEPFDFSSEIAGLVAFYGDRVIVEEHPA